MENFDEDRQADLDYGASKRFSGGSVFTRGIAMLTIGFVTGWLTGRPVNLPPERAPIVEDSSTRPQDQSGTADDDSISTNTEVIDTATVVAPEVAQVESISDQAIADSALPTPTSTEPETRLVLGDPNAPVKIVEFSDYECPFCARYSQTTFLRLKQNYIDTGRVYYEFKDFPLTSIHPTAPRVHEVGQCVYELNGVDTYWEAHDIFFNTQNRWGGNLPQAQQDAVLVELMAELDVDKAELQDCLESGRYVADVQADMDEGRLLGLTGTPSFFINGFPLVGALPYDVFEEVIGLAERGELAQVIAESQQEQQRAASAQAAARLPVDVALGESPAKGDPNAPVTIIEYSDYQCPFCARHATTTMAPLQNYIDAGQVYYVFKDFPLDSIHPQAQKAHEAARCVRELGGENGYWDMHDLLFKNQGSWGSSVPPNHIPSIKALAGQLGFNQAEFDNCLDSGKYYDAVRAEVVEGIGFSITGTPTFFINGERLVGAQPFETFEGIILQLAAEAGQPIIHPVVDKGYQDISVNDLALMLPDKDITLINTHVPYAGDIPTTDLSIPFDQLLENQDILPADKNAPIVVYCRSGNMSTQAAETLVRLGYTNVKEVDGGMNAWVQMGQSLDLE